jgi:hypothetical protein
VVLPGLGFPAGLRAPVSRTRPLITGICVGSLLLLATPTEVGAQYTLEISNVYASIERVVPHTTLRPGETFVLPQNSVLKRTDLAYWLDVKVDKGAALRLRVFSAETLDHRPWLLEREFTESTVTIFPRSSVDLSFALINNSSHTTEVSATVTMVGGYEAETVARYRQLLDVPLKALDVDYVLPEINVSVKPCGASNASSTRTVVVICSELLAELRSRHQEEALPSIVLHEVAHTLLNVWGLPGYENEELADEFAALRQRRDPNGLAAFVQWLGEQDSTSEALEQLINGDRHPISIQRTRNIKAASENPQLLERWERLLSSHARLASTASAPAGVPASAKARPSRPPIR